MLTVLFSEELRPQKPLLLTTISGITPLTEGWDDISHINTLG
jgi:hypothetical protein